MNCEKCLNSGAITARHKENQGVYTFVCDCDNGKHSHWAKQKKMKHDISHWSIGVWNIELNRNYMILK